MSAYNNIFGTPSEVLSGLAASSLVHGEALSTLKSLPAESVDCIITSPPYWKQREYEVSEYHSSLELGNEDQPQQYVAKLAAIFHAAKRILKPSGSLWLNIGDKYHNKNLMGMPWRVALAMQDDGWILRNDIIWDQMKGTQSPKDRLRDVYEHIFHFVKSQKYYYDSDSIRIKPDKLPSENGNGIVSATGVSGVKYKQQIAESKVLSEMEKQKALEALEETLGRLRNGELVDFRMTIRGAQRTYHGENGNISGRAKELEERGFFIMKSSAKGYIPSDIWRIVPEDKWRKDTHCAVFPEELLLNPIKATCPNHGIILDPFVGTGSSVAAALRMQRRAVGIDLSEVYLATARKRISEMAERLNTLPLLF
ncbi:MAG: site-specific DNA-methyltransferase [Candidatus Kapabacteria bacterium]|jgi:DNA modification methylase|nr:site-specific DNA-methyltransferase [Candidatus Kapabacteria bacterium]